MFALRRSGHLLYPDGCATYDGPRAKSTGRRGSAEEGKGVGQAAQSRATAIRNPQGDVLPCAAADDFVACTCCRRRRHLPRLRCRWLLSRLRAPSLSSSSATLHRRRRLHRLHLRKQLPRLTCLSSKLCHPGHRKAQDGCPDQMFDPHMETTPKFMLIVSFFGRCLRDFSLREHLLNVPDACESSY
jgi:hypothetical protein